MSRLVIEVDMANAAFDDDPTLEVNRILSLLQSAFMEHGLPEGLVVFPLYDVNGNAVGAARLEEDDNE